MSNVQTKASVNIHHEGQKEKKNHDSLVRGQLLDSVRPSGGGGLMGMGGMGIWWGI